MCVCLRLERTSMNLLFLHLQKSVRILKLEMDLFTWFSARNQSRPPKRRAFPSTCVSLLVLTFALAVSPELIPTTLAAQQLDNKHSTARLRSDPRRSLTMFPVTVGSSLCTYCLFACVHIQNQGLLHIHGTSNNVKYILIVCVDDSVEPVLGARKKWRTLGCFPVDWRRRDKEITMKTTVAAHLSPSVGELRR